jgi:hypothetical protein
MTITPNPYKRKISFYWKEKAFTPHRAAFKIMLTLFILSGDRDRDCIKDAVF